MEPSTAMPSAPATWRTVLLTAEPTPAFSRGRVDMIDSVAGGTTFAIPTPWMKNSEATTQIGVAASMNTTPTSEADVSAKPTADTARGPNRLTVAALRGANTS